MFDIGWDEMALVAVLALVVIGPKELPTVLRQVGHWVKKGRGLAADFQRGLDDMVRESEMADLRAEIERLSRPDALKDQITKTVDPDGKVAEALSPPDLSSPNLARIDTPAAGTPTPAEPEQAVPPPDDAQRPPKP